MTTCSSPRSRRRRWAADSPRRLSKFGAKGSSSRWLDSFARGFLGPLTLSTFQSFPRATRTSGWTLATPRQRPLFGFASTASSTGGYSMVSPARPHESRHSEAYRLGRTRFSTSHQNWGFSPGLRHKAAQRHWHRHFRRRENYQERIERTGTRGARGFWERKGAYSRRQ